MSKLKVDKTSSETVGKASLDRLKKSPDTTCPIELERALHTEYEQNVLECVERTRKNVIGDFFVVVLTKKEVVLTNVLRHYFFCRISCPTPDYDQTVYKYFCKDERLEFIWVIPSRETCFIFRENAAKIAPAEYGLLNFVLKFDDKTLARLAKKLNNEVDESSELEK